LNRRYAGEANTGRRLRGSGSREGGNVTVRYRRRMVLKDRFHRRGGGEKIKAGWFEKGGGSNRVVTIGAEGG